jgi:hypothetical protein
MTGWQQFALEATPWVAKVTFFAALGFIAGYSVLARWWRTSIGWTIVLLDLVIAVLLIPDMLLELFGINVTGDEFWTLFVLIAIACVPLIIAWRFTILARAQWRHRKDPR